MLTWILGGLVAFFVYREIRHKMFLYKCNRIVDETNRILKQTREMASQ